MPFKIYFLNVILIVGGFLIAYWLRRRWILLILFLGLVIFLCGIFLPCFPLFGTPFCRGDHHQKIIALTFDDGPNEPYTSLILSVLRKQGVHATFFVLGENAVRFPMTVSRIVMEGHVIGNHTMDHAPLALKSRAEILREIEEWEKVVGMTTDKLFRAPHGWKSPFLSSVLREKGYALIGWTRGVWDSDRPGADVLFDRITRHPEKGMILLLHDGEDTKIGRDRSQTVAVLPRVIEYYRNLGYRFVTLPEMLP